MKHDVASSCGCHTIGRRAVLLLGLTAAAPQLPSHAAAILSTAIRVAGLLEAGKEVEGEVPGWSVTTLGPRAIATWQGWVPASLEATKAFIAARGLVPQDLAIYRREPGPQIRTVRFMVGTIDVLVNFAVRDKESRIVSIECEK